MLQTLTEYLKAKECLVPNLTKLKAFIQDDTKDLEERWDVYCSIEEDLDTDSYYLSIPNLPDYGEVVFYDDLHCDKYQTISGTEIVMRLSEAYKENPASPEDLKVLKETILQDGSGSWVYDW